MRISRTRVAVAGIVGLATMGLIASPAFADTVGVTGTQNATLTGGTVSPFSALTLDGTSKTSTATLGDFTAIDARGTGLGWSVTAHATQWVGSGGAATHDLATGQTTLGAISAATLGTGSNTAPTLASSQVIDNSAVTIATAAVGNGMGTYTLVSPTGANDLTVAFPASSYAGTYTSTITFSIVQAP